jgi:hypothetical protein
VISCSSLTSIPTSTLFFGQQTPDRYLPQPKDQDVLVYLRHTFARPPEQNKNVQPFSNSGRRSNNSTIIKHGKNFDLISLKI